MSRLSQYISLGVSVLDRMVRPRLSRITFLITYWCNQKCATCDIWKLPRQSISIEEFSKFCSINKDLLWICLCGGEPFILSDTRYILQSAMGITKLVSVTTNGAFSEKICSDVEYALGREKSTLAVNVSFEGPEDYHDKIASIKGSFKRALKTYSLLRELTKVYKERLRVGISYTSSALNPGQYWNFARSLGDLFPGVEGMTYGMAQEASCYCWEDNKPVVPKDSTIKDFSREMIKNMGNRNDPFNWVSLQYLKGYLNGHRPECVAGQYTVIVDPYWNVYPCMFTCPTYPIGNLKESNFDLSRIDLEKARSIVKYCKKPCWTPCETYNTIIFRPWRLL